LSLVQIWVLHHHEKNLLDTGSTSTGSFLVPISRFLRLLSMRLQNNFQELEITTPLNSLE
tara:strand:+ start:281 stop:460 length:180 start_codon:yes stop_codon:yes gene_type:complete